MPTETSVTAFRCDGCKKTFPSSAEAAGCEARHANDQATAPLIAARDSAKVVYEAAVTALQAACKHLDKKETGSGTELDQGDGQSPYVDYHCPRCDKSWRH